MPVLRLQYPDHTMHKCWLFSRSLKLCKLSFLLCRIMMVFRIVSRCTPLLLQWRGGRYFYIRAMTEHQKRILRRHKSVLFGDESVRRFGPFDVDKIFAASTLLELDVHYSHRRAGFKSCEEYYQWSSCCNYLHKVSRGNQKQIHLALWCAKLQRLWVNGMWKGKGCHASFYASLGAMLISLS